MQIKRSLFCATCGNWPYDFDPGYVSHREHVGLRDEISLCLLEEFAWLIFTHFRPNHTPMRFPSSSSSRLLRYTSQDIYGCHVDIAMCLLANTTYQCAHTDLILSRFCQTYARTQRRSPCQDIRTRQAFMNYTQRTRPACKLTFDAGDIFRNHAVCYRYVLASHSPSYRNLVCSSLIMGVIRKVQSCSSNHGRLL